METIGQGIAKGVGQGLKEGLGGSKIGGVVKTITGGIDRVKKAKSNFYKKKENELNKVSKNNTVQQKKDLSAFNKNQKIWKKNQLAQAKQNKIKLKNFANGLNNQAKENKLMNTLSGSKTIGTLPKIHVPKSAVLKPNVAGLKSDPNFIAAKKQSNPLNAQLPKVKAPVSKQPTAVLNPLKKYGFGN